MLSNDPLSVTVTGGTPKEHWFAPVIGHDSTAVSADGDRRLGQPQPGHRRPAADLLLVRVRADDRRRAPPATRTRPTATIYFTKTSNTTGCTGPSNNIVPGGFAYLDTPSGRCEAASARNERSYSKTGNSVPSACSTADFSEWLGQTVLLPLFDESGDTGNNAWYQVYGYAAFKLTGYHLGGQYSAASKPCNGNDRCVAGYFTRFVELSDAWIYGPDAPQLGASDPPTDPIGAPTRETSTSRRVRGPRPPRRRHGWCSWPTCGARTPAPWRASAPSRCWWSTS